MFEKMPKKFYVVVAGRVPGIYLQWSDAQKQVDRFYGARHKGFVDLQGARDWWHQFHPHAEPYMPAAAPDPSAANKPALQQQLDLDASQLSPWPGIVQRVTSADRVDHMEARPREAARQVELFAEGDDEDQAPHEERVFERLDTPPW